jgi:hypothetical protein
VKVVDAVVLGELGGGEPGVPDVLAVVAVGAKHVFQREASTFGLTVGLGVVRGRHGELGVEEGKERVPKSTCEAGVCED